MSSAQVGNPHTVGTGWAVSRWVRWIYIGNLIAQSGIIVTGAVVRITGSGLGCPTWPQCVEGSYTPTVHQAESWHKYVEFGNRLLTFVLAILAILAVIAAISDRVKRSRAGGPRRTAIFVLAFVPLVGTAAQAVLGGITVLTGLNPVTVAAHFLVSIALMAACVALVVRSGEPGDQPIHWLVPNAVRWLTYTLVAAGLAVVVLGVLVTGSGPHSGDAETEARFPFDPRTVAWLHADAVLLFIGLLVGVLVSASIVSQGTLLRKRATIVLVVALIQGAVGYGQFFAGLPATLVAIHVVGAVLTWLALLFVLPALRTRGLAVSEHG